MTWKPPPRVTALGILAAAVVAAVGVVAAATADAPASCQDLRRQLAENRGHPVVTSLETLSEEEWALLGVLTAEGQSLVREVRDKDCD